MGCFIRSEQVTFKAELVGGVGVIQVKGGDHRVPGYSLEARAERGHGETAFLPPRSRAGVAFCRTSRAVRRTRNRERVFETLHTQVTDTEAIKRGPRRHREEQNVVSVLGSPARSSIPLFPPQKELLGTLRL